MKAIILAAGKGTRLGAITEEMPKPMLPVKGRPVISYHLENCRRNGVTDVAINLHHVPEKLTSYVGDGSAFGVNVTYRHETELLGTAGTVRNFADWLDGERFFVIYGDNFTDFNLTDLYTFHLASNADVSIALGWKEDVSQSGIVVLDEVGRVLKFIEKPKTPEEQVSHLVNGGIYVCEPDILEWIPEGVSDFGRQIFPTMLEDGARLYAKHMDGVLEGIDTIQMLRHVEDTYGTEKAKS
ncbi:MAG: nucleotidyltransferase family protein [Candidatus Poribacteria bacterium]|nr:nucleotidyltransferase family protein [Candidatus Poribacteria bacterium]